jgi:hypothetical protein
MNRGLEALDTIDGQLDRRVLGTQWRIPDSIELKEGKLWYANESRSISARPGLVEEFLGLVSASDEQIADFARRWGMLHLCGEHGLPERHLQYPHWIYSGQTIEDPQWLFCSRRGAPVGPFSESIDAWRSLARQWKATLDVASFLQRRELPRDEVWRVAFNLDSEPSEDFRHVKYLYDYTVPQSVSHAKKKLGLRLNQWIELGRVRPYVETNVDHLRITFGSYDLFGAIAIQLALVATRTEGLAMCSVCGRAYPPTRRPRSDQRNYCPTCRKDGADRRNAHVNYALKGQAQRLSQRGLEVGEIASDLGIDSEQVKQLLKLKKVSDPDR